MRSSITSSTPANPLTRIKIIYAALLFIACIFAIRLFYLQIIKHGHYQNAAITGQLKEYEIPASRGLIEAYDGDKIVPIVLNEKKYTLFADPMYIEDPAEAAEAVQRIIGGSADDYRELMGADTRYAVLAKKLDKDQRDALDGLEIKGIGTREEEYRTYPQGQLAAQLLGFVNDDGEGKYGIEQYLDKELRGRPGQLRAITDARGIPLVSNKDNVAISPVAGENAVLTIDIAMQRHVEDILKKGVEAAKSKFGSAVVMDPKTGAVKAMANFPSYNPAEFYKVEDAAVFNNAAASEALEVGSVMKPLTLAAALDKGVVSRDTTYYDPGFMKIDGATITNVEESGGAGIKSMGDILRLSLNTGASFLLAQMGGGEVNEQARVTWHDYMVNHYGFGRPTGVEQGFEASGTIPDPLDGFGLNIQYANTSFGQGMTATPLQVAAAISSVLNGGTYYKPYLIDRTIDGKGGEVVHEPVAVRSNVVHEGAGKAVKELMEEVIRTNYRTYGFDRIRAEYAIGGKTGTAQIADSEGGYYTDRFNGVFMGFVGGDSVDYVIVVRVDEPKIPGYAGSRAAGPIFADIANMLIDTFSVTPKSR